MKLWLFAVGTLSMLVQVVLLREVTVTFFGSELVLVLALGMWLLGTALGALVAGPRHHVRRQDVRSADWRGEEALGDASLGDGASSDDATLRWLFVALGVLVLLALSLARGARRLLHGVPGAELPLLHQLFVLAACLLPVSAALGFLFVRSARCAVGTRFGLGDAYALESAGALVGGLLATGVAIAGLQNIVAAGAGAAFACAAATCRWRRTPVHAVAAIAAVAIAVGTFTLAPRLDRATTAWNHPQLVLTRDTPYGRVTVTASAGQITVFENDALAYESQSTAAEAFVHLAAAQRDSLRMVLVLGGFVTGLLPEILRHQPQQVDDVELDAALLEQVTPHLPASLQQARRDPRLHLRVEDPRRFLARPAAYDLVLLGMPEPESGRTNRYYTREFFALCARRMQPAGVLALRLRGAENLWTPQTLRRLASVERALRTEFADVVVLPGATNLLLASRAPLDRAPSLLSARLDRRGVGSALVRPPYVRYLYTNDRFDEIMALLHDTAVPANADARPSCYQTTMLLWLARFFPRLARVQVPTWETRALARSPWTWVAVVVVCGGLAAWRPRPRLRAALFAAVAGGAGMLLEAVLLVDFQTRSGVLYQDLGWLITAFMCGITMGAAALPRVAGAGRRHPTPSRRIGVFVALVLAAAALGTLLYVQRPAAPGRLATAALLAVAGAGVGAGFTYATARSRTAPHTVLGAAYAGDVLGGCLASLAAALWLVPVVGLPGTVGVVAVCTPIALAVLL